MGLGTINPKGPNIAFDLTIAIITRTSCIISSQMVFQILNKYPNSSGLIPQLSRTSGDDHASIPLSAYVDDIKPIG
jgi:hypothetical protein